MYDYTKIDDFILRAENIAKTHDKEEAFKIISSEIESCDDRYLNDYVGALNYVRHEKTLEWIERNVHRVKNISESWGQVAASSQFNWATADKWLSNGRPLSLIALDALKFCTTIDERLNQSPWMREIQPKLTDNPRPEMIAKKLTEYLKTDNVPRTKSTVEKIISNVFETTK